VASECPAHAWELLLAVHFLLQAKEAEAPVTKKKRRLKIEQKIAQLKPLLFECKWNILTPFLILPDFDSGKG
jgi:hypothetical protein